MFYNHFFNGLVDMFSVNAKDMEEQYLAESENRYDLEVRMREIERGKAPFQRRYSWPM